MQIIELLTRIRAWWPQPRAQRIARRKRRLELLLREHGLSRSEAATVTRAFFSAEPRPIRHGRSDL